MNKKFQILVVAILPFLLVGCSKPDFIYSGVDCDGKPVKRDRFWDVGDCSPSRSALNQAIFEKDFITAKKLIAEGHGINEHSGSCRVLKSRRISGTYSLDPTEYRYSCRTEYRYVRTPLELAVEKNAPTEFIRELIEKGANVNTTTGNGETPLHFAARGDSPKAVSLLLANGADVNAKDKDGDTPLHYAASRNHPKAVSLLLANGADVNAKDKKGRTPLDLAVERDKTEAIRAFNASSADIARAKQEEERRKEAEERRRVAEVEAEERAKMAKWQRWQAEAAASERRKQQFRNTLNVFTDAMVDLGNQRRANEAARQQQQAAAYAAQQAEYARQAAE